MAPNSKIIPPQEGTPDDVYERLEAYIEQFDPDWIKNIKPASEVASAPESAGAGLFIAAKGSVELKKGVEKLDRSWNFGKKAKNAYKQYGLDKETDFKVVTSVDDIVDSSMKQPNDKHNYAGASSFKSIARLTQVLISTRIVWKLEVNEKELVTKGLGFEDDDHCTI